MPSNRMISQVTGEGFKLTWKSSNYTIFWPTLQENPFERIASTSFPLILSWIHSNLFSQTLCWQIQCQFLILILLTLWAAIGTFVHSFSWLPNLFLWSGPLPWSPDSCIQLPISLLHLTAKAFQTEHVQNQGLNFFFLNPVPPPSIWDFSPVSINVNSIPSWAKNLEVIFDSPLFLIPHYQIHQKIL